MFTFMTRFLLLMLFGGVGLLFFRTVLIGNDTYPVPDGWRKSMIACYFTYVARLWMFVCGFCTHDIEEVEVDYTYYLGPGYKEQFKKVKCASTVVSNHVSLWDSQNITQYMLTAYTLDEMFLNAPLMGSLGAVLDSIFIPRGGTEEEK